MLRILQAFRIPREIVDAIRGMYENSMARVISPDEKWNFLKFWLVCFRGTSLPCTCLSLYLTMLWEWLLMEKRKHLDSILWSEEGELDQRWWQTWTLLMTLHYWMKCKICYWGLRHQLQDERRKDNVHVIQPKQDCEPNHKWWRQSWEGRRFKYWGTSMSGTAKDIQQRKVAAWRAFSKLNKIWKSSLSVKFKLWLFTATVESVLLCSCEDGSLLQS